MGLPTPPRPDQRGLAVWAGWGQACWHEARRLCVVSGRRPPGGSVLRHGARWRRTFLLAGPCVRSRCEAAAHLLDFGASLAASAPMPCDCGADAGPAVLRAAPDAAHPGWRQLAGAAVLARGPHRQGRVRCVGIRERGCWCRRRLPQLATAAICTQSARAGAGAAGALCTPPLPELPCRPSATRSPGPGGGAAAALCWPCRPTGAGLRRLRAGLPRPAQPRAAPRHPGAGLGRRAR